MDQKGKSYATFGRYSADLCLFFIVAECGQLTKAAHVAGVSQPRLSQRMKALEESLGQQLLIRGRRGVSLTRAGQGIIDDVRPYMRNAAEAFRRVCEDPQRNTVTILSDMAFASFRLLPVYSALCEAFKTLSISLLTVQVPRLEDGSDADLVIRMEELHEPRDTETCLFRETISIVCSPGYKRLKGPFHTPRDLLGQSLIGLSAAGAAPWLTWSNWFNHVGLDAGEQNNLIRFNSYDNVIRSAVDGLGLALGWTGLIDDHLDRGVLVNALPDRLSSNQGYYLKLTQGNQNPNARAVFDWISENIQECHTQVQPAGN